MRVGIVGLVLEDLKGVVAAEPVRGLRVEAAADAARRVARPVPAVQGAAPERGRAAQGARAGVHREDEGDVRTARGYNVKEDKAKRKALAHAFDFKFLADIYKAELVDLDAKPGQP